MDVCAIHLFCVVRNTLCISYCTQRQTQFVLLRCPTNNRVVLCRFHHIARDKILIVFRTRRLANKRRRYWRIIPMYIHSYVTRANGNKCVCARNKRKRRVGSPRSTRIFSSVPGNSAPGVDKKVAPFFLVHLLLRQKNPCYLSS